MRPRVFIRVTYFKSLLTIRWLMLQPQVAREQIGMRVLLIEDDSATAQSIELMLTSASFNAYTTDLGEEGVDLGKLYDYDIILLDLNLPDMSGFEVLRSLRVSKVKTPILILSGLAGIEDKVSGLGYGADGTHMQHALPVVPDIPAAPMSLPRARGTLDRDHVSAEIGQRLDAHWAKQKMVEADDANSLQ